MSDINNTIIDYSLIAEFDVGLLQQQQTVPLYKDDFLLCVAASKEANFEYIQTQCHLPLKIIEVEKSELIFILQSLPLKQKIYENALASVRQKESSTSYIQDFLEALIAFSIKKRSSDIHIETQEHGVSIRLRIDGLLQHFFLFEKEFYKVLGSVVKLIASLDITQKRLPQNGRFSKQVNGQTYDFRVSIMPTIQGESVVIRILDTNSVHQSLYALGFEKQQLQHITKMIHAKQGLILVTGPTGSGKTTTLYSILETINSVDKKIMTIEDPIEYQIPRIQQIPVNHDINLGFAEILVDVLRQDPDCIMVGEIRDKESLKIALRASLTGHLVLATLHANDAIATINRLLDLEAEAHILASTLKLVIAQRLVLKLCDDCKHSVKNKEYKAVGCETCNLTGFSGRTMLCEVLRVDEKVASMIIHKESSHTIHEYVKTQGYLSLFEQGMQKVQDGVTTLEEVYKVTTL